jgi:hypothetical protein
MQLRSGRVVVAAPAPAPAPTPVPTPAVPAPVPAPVQEVQEVQEVLHPNDTLLSYLLPPDIGNTLYTTMERLNNNDITHKELVPEFKKLLFYFEEVNTPPYRTPLSTRSLLFIHLIYIGFNVVNLKFDRPLFDATLHRLLHVFAQMKKYLPQHIIMPTHYQHFTELIQEINRLLSQPDMYEHFTPEQNRKYEDAKMEWKAAHSPPYIYYNEFYDFLG